MLKSKSANSCQQQHTAIAGLESDITELKKEIETCKSSPNDGGDNGEVVGGQPQQDCPLSPNVSCNDSGRDIVDAPGNTAKDCCKGCNEIPGCTAFTHDQGTCRFKFTCKSNTTSTAVSGVIPRGQDLCLNGREPVDKEKSWWKHLGIHPSCGGDFTDVGFSQCTDDPTSISFNMAEVSKKGHRKDACFAYHTEQRKFFQPKDISEITFDAQWDQCGDVWTAPIWLKPAQWRISQGLSGEIDFIETCHANKVIHSRYGVKTAIICEDHITQSLEMRKPPFCREPVWGHGHTSNGAKHFRGKFHNNGDWTMHKCDNLKETNVKNCQLISRYPKYLQTNNGSINNMNFHFVSDLWGHEPKPGSTDRGFEGCGNKHKPDTNCSYTVANIRVVPRQ